MCYTKDGNQGGRSVKDAEMTHKTAIARFAGSAFVAEREGEELVIYHVGDDPLATDTHLSLPGAVGDGAPMTPAKLQKVIELSRARRRG